MPYAPEAQTPPAQPFTGVLWLDMDGVIADYELGAAAAGIEPDQFLNEPGAFRDLALMPYAYDAVHRLKDHLGLHRLKFLSKPADERWDASCLEKLDWMAEHFPSIPQSHIHLVKDKATRGMADDLLVDDHPEWSNAENFPGHVLKFEGPHSWAKVFHHVGLTSHP